MSRRAGSRSFAEPFKGWSGHTLQDPCDAALIVLAARASGIPAFDGVFNDLEDMEGFAAECAEGRSLGFDGKSLIHPKQIESCNRAFSPSEDELARARRLVEALAAARSDSKGR